MARKRTAVQQGPVPELTLEQHVELRVDWLAHDLQYQRKTLLEDVTSMAKRLRDLADDLEREACRHVDNPHVYDLGNLSEQVVHTFNWGIANAGLDAVVREGNRYRDAREQAKPYVGWAVERMARALAPVCGVRWGSIATGEHYGPCTLEPDHAGGHERVTVRSA